MTAELLIDVAGEEPDTLIPLDDDERAELLRLRNEVRALKNGNYDLAMVASIKLAAARMVLSQLLGSSRLDGRERMALQGVFDMLPVGTSVKMLEGGK